MMNKSDTHLRRLNDAAVSFASVCHTSRDVPIQSTPPKTTPMIMISLAMMGASIIAGHTMVELSITDLHSVLQTHGQREAQDQSFAHQDDD